MKTKDRRKSKNVIDLRPAKHRMLSNKPVAGLSEFKPRFSTRQSKKQDRLK